MTVTLPATPPATQPHPIQTRAQDIYHHCLENGVRVKLVSETRGGFEILTFTCRIPARKDKETIVIAPTKKKKHVSRSRWLRNKRRRLAWLEKRNQHASNQATATSPPTCPAADQARPPAHVPNATPPVARRTRAAKRRKMDSPAASPETLRAYQPDTLDWDIPQTSPSPRSPDMPMLEHAAFESWNSPEENAAKTSVASSPEHVLPPSTSPTLSPASPSTPTAACRPACLPKVVDASTGVCALTRDLTTTASYAVVAATPRLPPDRLLEHYVRKCIHCGTSSVKCINCQFGFSV